ncbi:DUF11 domain-containing protein [Halorussus salinus]|uniref:DUF11 domain-containing protein n=1 Tax=Halorussus salinus TaxID=1364935 RepID=UPI001093039D|nr:DUF11 domain-containing protein [Halorussus salinus]
MAATSGTVEGSAVANENVANTEAELALNMSGHAEEVEEGYEVRLEVTVRNEGNGTSPAPVFDLGRLPDGWAVASWSGSGATYRESTNEWLWTEVESEASRDLSITMTADSRTDSATISGEVTDGYDHRATDDIRIETGRASSGAGGGAGGQSISETTSTSEPTETVEATTTVETTATTDVTGSRTPTSTVVPTTSRTPTTATRTNWTATSRTPSDTAIPGFGLIGAVVAIVGLSVASASKAEE